jgi:hypothetical protein
MFVVDCPTCGGTRLVTSRQITAIENGHVGIRVHFTCVCGLDGVWITGRGATTRTVVWAVDAAVAGEAVAGEAAA